MPKLKLIIALMILVGVIIVGIAAYIVANFSNISSTQGIILIVIGAVALFLVMGVMFFLYKGLTAKK
jgi:hypothetical protein